jgi:hypothetical protein
MMAGVYIPSYLGGRDLECHYGRKKAKKYATTYIKIIKTKTKRLEAGGVAQLDRTSA